MSRSLSPFRLKVQQIEQVCSFELTWGRGQQLTATLPYPPELELQYREWQRSYLSFYKTLQYSIAPAVAPPSDQLRGRVVSSGSLGETQVDWHRKLAQAETKLLSSFHHWLRSAELFELRSVIAQAGHSSTTDLNLFLTCSPLDLARLPWESWDLGSEFGLPHPVRIVRSPTNIRAETITPQRRSRRTRILVILGDDTGLSLQSDQAAVRSLNRVADIRVLGWQAGQSVTAWKQILSEAIADEQGWDILFFAGHSDETQLTGGELGIAPGVAIGLRELVPYLQKAQARGLQFALFNSCSGLNLAETLIDLGLSQVAVMREPIHNQVAHVFLARFLQSLAQFQDVHEALISACQQLKLAHNLTYPSAHLVPSLFCHPDADLFRLKSSGWRQQLQAWMPKPREAIALLLVLGVSWQVPIQAWLLDQRMLMQAVYRDWTGQVPTADPPLLLVQIDNESLVEDGISNPQPMDRRYLARLVTQATDLGANVIGVDYVLDRPQAEADQQFAAALENAAAQETQVVLAAIRDDVGAWLPPVAQAPEITEQWFGDIRLWGDGRYMPLLFEPDQPLPFSHLIALSHWLHADSQQPVAQAEIEARAEQLAAVPSLLSARTQLNSITTFSYHFGQLWLHPVSDFSIPPQQVYQRIPSWQFLRLDASRLKQDYGQSTVIIMPGGYGEAGFSDLGEDNFPLPPALHYWQQPRTVHQRWKLPGGEVHAYNAYHLVHQRLVVPIPDLWGVALMVIVGKGISLIMVRNPHRRHWSLGIGASVLAYGWLSLQLYISAALLLPWLLPMLTLGFYTVPELLPPRRLKDL